MDDLSRPASLERRFDLSGRVALVTGGNGGIGLAIARGLASAGAGIVIAARDAEKSAAACRELAAAGGAAEALALDLVDPAAAEGAVSATVKTFGRLDILVNNAGTTVRKRPELLTDEEWRRVLDTNLDAVFRLSRAAYPHLKASGAGRVINIGSMLSIFGTPWAPAYAASKGGIVQFSRALATAWAADGITVNCILPGWIDTYLTRGARADVPGLHEKVLSGTPMGRWGSTGDFEGIAIFLASDAASFVTGTAIPVDGGYSVLL